MKTYLLMMMMKIVDDDDSDLNSLIRLLWRATLVLEIGELLLLRSHHDHHDLIMMIMLILIVNYIS